MKISEITAPDPQQRQVDALKQSAKNAQQVAKTAQARVGVQKAQKQLVKAQSIDPPKAV